MGPIWRERVSDSANNDVRGQAASDSQQSVQAPQGGAFPALISRILSSRGINRENFEEILYPKLSSLKDPATLLGMQVATERMAKAFLENEKICIYADFDLDGTSGLALLKTGLERIGFNNVVYFQPKRLSEGYGFHARFVEELKSQGVSLIITVDVGITALEACSQAQSLGVDVILTDHHLPGEELPKALVIVNPNQPADTSGLNYLCGAGVAFYLLRSLKRYFHEHPNLPKNNFDLKEVLDFFTIATLTDMVPLQGDNRVLVKHGLIKLENTDKPGLRALLEALGLHGRPLTAQDVSIRFAPKLNALSRMEAGVLPIDIMLISDEKKAQSLVEEVLAQNSNRVQLQSNAEQQALELLKTWTESEFVFVASSEFHRGIVGLIATKLSQSFNRPAYVGSIGSDGMIVGSSRLPPGHESCLVEALGAASAQLTRFGGHSAAAGFELFGSRQQEFIANLSSFYQERKNTPKPIQLEYDAKVELEEVNANSMKWYDFVGPFGVGFPVPLLRFCNLKLESLRELRGGHYRLKLMDLKKNSSVEALLFSPSSNQIAQIEALDDQVEILGELQWNYFNGQKSIQILVRDFKGLK